MNRRAGDQTREPPASIRRLHIVHHHVVVFCHLIVFYHVVRLNDPEDGRDWRGELGEHRHVGDVLDAHSEFAHIAGGQCHNDKFIGGGISQVVVEIADDADDAIARRSRIGRGLTGRLKIAMPNRLVALGAEIEAAVLRGCSGPGQGRHIVASMKRSPSPSERSLM